MYPKIIYSINFMKKKKKKIIYIYILKIFLIKIKKK